MKRSMMLVLSGLLIVSGTVFSGGKQESKVTELSFAIHTQPNTIEHRAAQKMKETVEAKSGGRYVLKLFPGATLGGEKDNIEQLKINEVQLSIFGDILPSVLAAKYSPTVIPFIYPNIEAVYAAWNGPLGVMMKKSIEENGLVLLGLQERGARNLTANRPVRGPDDLKGLKIRVPEIPTWVKVWAQFGALPTPVAWPEVYNALQLKVVDAQENPYANISTAKLYEVQKYLVHTKHLYNVFHWAGSKRWFDALSDADKQLMLSTVKDVTAWADQETKAEASKLLADLKAKGMEVIEVDGAAFRKIALPAIREIAKDWAPGVYDHVKQYLE